MLCLGIACSHVHSVEAVQSRHQKVVCIARYFYIGFGHNIMTAMARIQLLAVLTMDGCPAETVSQSGQWLSPERYGINELKEDAVRILNENTSLIWLSSQVEKAGNSPTYMIEATNKTTSIINGMIRMRLVDEIFLYLIPMIAGNGCRLFQSFLPESEWICTGTKRWKDGMIRITYVRKTPRQPVVVFKK